MKNYCYLLILLTLGCTGKVTITEEEIGAEVFYVNDSFRPYSGKCMILFNNSAEIKEQFTYKKGMLHGEAIAWYKNGKIRRKGSYRKGQIEGKWEFWDKNGNKTVEAHYKADNLDGAYLLLYANGNIKEKGQFESNKRSGKWMCYADNGQLISSDPE